MVLYIFSLRYTFTMRVVYMLAVGALEIYFYITFCQQKTKIKTLRHERPVSARGNIYIGELGGCVKVEVAVLRSLSLKVLMVSVDVKQHLKKKKQ